MTADVPWHILRSTMVRAVAYDPATAQLRVRFVNGSVYRYLAVPEDVALNLIDPPDGSSGRYFNDHVRDSFDYDEER